MMVLINMGRCCWCVACIRTVGASKRAQAPGAYCGVSRGAPCEADAGQVPRLHMRGWHRPCSSLLPQCLPMQQLQPAGLQGLHAQRLSAGCARLCKARRWNLSVASRAPPGQQQRRCSSGSRMCGQQALSLRLASSLHVRERAAPLPQPEQEGFPCRPPWTAAGRLWP